MAPAINPVVLENRRDRSAATSPRLVSLLIGGRDVPASSSAAFERLSPVSGDLVTVSAAATLEDAVAAADAAAAAFPGWSQSSPGHRRNLLERAADLLVARAPDFTAAMMAETGATREWSRFNVELGARIFQEAAAATTQVGGSIIPTDMQGRTSFAYRQPAGVCLAIAPWNAPVILGVRSIAIALACGNTVVLKSSELCPATHRLIGEVLQEAGLPEGVINIISNAPADASAIVETLIAHPVIRRINFTGSTRVGRIIAQTAAKHLKRCLLELGGKAAFIVLDDADLDEAVKAAAFGAYFNQGQICMSTERIIVMDEVADAFVEKFVAKARSLRAGDPLRGELPLSSLVTAESARRVRGLIDDSIAKGAVLLTGGENYDAMMDAAVVDHVTRPMRLYREESFGPVAVVIRVGSADEAVTVANDCEYGLSSAVFGRNIGRALDVARRIESGICHINSATVADEPQAPFGGVKASGYGKFGGPAALDEFTELRWITISDGTGDYPI
ncbi:aldehyde dehydrogenase [Agrobacterium salinitolerans]|uniref:aldehyde dehydrogenase n=1 Tax=Agrobacterium salinitolerans TaxID=1183413 RepID=UPI0022B81591|nr:aldehyde dehydrogenase [Agrobacterium salinitolerans]MCZ7976954.1 aldehyde dehydrogenase [Agrobacterium salinitolerans]